MGMLNKSLASTTLQFSCAAESNQNVTDPLPGKLPTSADLNVNKPEQIPSLPEQTPKQKFSDAQSISISALSSLGEKLSPLTRYLSQAPVSFLGQILDSADISSDNRDPSSIINTEVPDHDQTIKILPPRDTTILSQAFNESHGGANHVPASPESNSNDGWY